MKTELKKMKQRQSDIQKKLLLQKFRMIINSKNIKLKLETKTKTTSYLLAKTTAIKLRLCKHHNHTAFDKFKAVSKVLLLTVKLFAYKKISKNYI